MDATHINDVPIDQISEVIQLSQDLMGLSKVLSNLTFIDFNGGKQSHDYLHL